MSDAVIRPELPGTTRRQIDVGQVWTVDGEGARWFVLTPSRVIALFAGGADHTPHSLVFSYGDRLRLEQIATVYADSEKQGRHHFAASGERDAEYIALCQRCGGTPLAAEHRDALSNQLIP